jgi:tyrosine-protein phosphatase YwqE
MLNLLKSLGFGTKKEAQTTPALPTQILTTDIHSHLLAGIDDGAKTLEDSLALILKLKEAGYKRFVTTPHIMSDFYKNTPEIIREKLAELRQYLQENQVDIEIEAAAEYYADEWFMHKILKGDELLTFGNNYILIETGFQDKPRYLKQAIFDLQTSGYKPIFAHPERYQYLYNDFKTLEELYELGVLLQINLNSLSGYYGKAAQAFAEQMISKGMVHWVGSDCHHHRHADAIPLSQKSKFYNQLLALPLLNFELFENKN